MKQLDFKYLENECGLQILTGEACRLGMRLLCDFNEHGAELIRQYFGLPYDSKFQDSWNSSHTAGSIMLMRETLLDMAIFHALMFEKAIQVMVTTHNGTMAVYPQDKERDIFDGWLTMLTERKEVIRLFAMPSNIPGIGGSATHQISGRTQ